MRIVIDMQAVQTPYSGSRGVGRYTNNLVRALLTIQGEHEFYLALNGAFPDSVERIRVEYGDLIGPERIVVWQNHLRTESVVDGEIDKPNPAAVATAEIVRETFFASLQPDIVFSTNLQEGFSDGSVTSTKRIDAPFLYATTLHDLTPLHFEKQLLADETVRDWYRGKVRDAVASDILITDSEAARDDILKLTAADPDRVFSVLAGYDDQLFNSDPSSVEEIIAVRKKYNLPENFVFYFGGNDLCKNIDRLIKAYACLDEGLRSEYSLVLGGKSFVHDPYGNSHVGTSKTIADLGIEENVLTPGFILDEDLPLLLKACTCFVFASTHEGFGLPALEAMACGAAVIGSNRSSVGEVIANERAFFDPYNVDDIASKLAEVLTDTAMRQALRSEGLKRAGDFSWDLAARQLLDIFSDHVATAKVAKGGYLGEPMRNAINALAPFADDLSDDELANAARMLDETFSPSGKPTVYVDISTVVRLDDRTGIQRVTRAVAAGLIQDNPQDFDVELVYSSHDDLNFYAANTYKRDGLGVPASLGDNYIAFKPGDILLFLDQAPAMAINHADYIRHLRNIGVKVYFYVYDLIPVHHPEWFSDGGAREFANLMETVALADGAICCSRSSANAVKEYVATRLGPARLAYHIGYAHLGTDIEHSAPSLGMPSDANDVLTAMADRPTFLMVGTLEPRKGHAQTLAAFELLWRDGVDANLVIVGRWGWKMGDFDKKLKSHPQIGKKLFWLQGISDEFLEQVYAGSNCLIAASEAEGFGLPLIEAARHGLPLLARDIPVFREVAEDHATYFKADREPAVLADAIKSWLAAEGAVRPSSGMNMLSWRESVDELKRVMIDGNWLYVI